MRSRPVRNFGRIGDGIPIPNLIKIQQDNFNRFLQRGVPFDQRKDAGLESLLREVFPIESYDKTMQLEFVSYELEKARYTPQECRELGLTYGYPLKITCRLHRQNGDDIAEQAIYLGEVPIMIGGGEFIINGAERVIVSQLHRSPGVDFVVESKEGDRVLHGGRIIPERGSWLEISVTRKDVLIIRIDQSSKIPATIFLRAMSEEYGTTEQILRLFYKTRNVPTEKLDPKMWSVGPIVDTESGEIIVDAGTQIGDRVSAIQASSIEEVEVIRRVRDPLILNTLSEDECESHEQALLKIYARLRPGNPAQPDKAKQLFEEKFFDTNRYRLGRVGRFRLNRKFGLSIDENEMTLRPEDFLHTMRYIVGLRNNEGEVDDIDHLGNRRLRTIDELAADEIRKGLLKLRRTVQERMSMKDPEQIKRIADLVNSKSVSSSIDYFFGRGELSQVVDQTNALSQLTHERRLSALGPGGLNRKRAGFEVRDVHISHYGRICPIETPEGTNIGLIASLGIFATIDEYGFLVTPYQKVEKGKATDKVDYLRADEEMRVVFAPPGVLDDERKKIREGAVLARVASDLAQVDSDKVDYLDISPKQIVGVSASLIPFLEHDDANRALMGSNMQRQAVPLLNTEPPVVGTGMEEAVAQNSSMVVRAKDAGKVTAVDAEHIVINGTDEYKLEKFIGLNERTCLNQRPIVKLGEEVKENQIIADGGGTAEGALSLGKNVLVAFVPFDGYNFEDAILVSERLVQDDVFTSIHIDEFSVEIRETKLGREEFTCDIPNVSEKALRNLDENGIVREGTRVFPGDILVGKVSPKSKTELTPEEKLLHAIFGRAGEDVKNDSLEVPSGYEGFVIKTKRFTRNSGADDEHKKSLKEQMKAYSDQMKAKECGIFRQMADEIRDKLGEEVQIVDPSTLQRVGASEDNEVVAEQIDGFDISWVKPANMRDEAKKIVDNYWPKIKNLQEEEDRKLARMKHGDELPSGVLEMVKIYVATKRTLSIGDKMAGRHGNKGVIARIMPVEDMPFLEDGTPVDILLNPLGVPSRMNVGQILETHLGWAAKVLGFDAVTPVFDGASEDDIVKVTADANERVRYRLKELDGNISINTLDEFFDKAEVAWVTIEGFKEDDPNLGGTLNLLEGRTILKYPDSNGFGSSKEYMPFFNSKKPQDQKGIERKPGEFENIWNQSVRDNSLLLTKFQEIESSIKWQNCSTITTIPKLPGIYLFRIGNKVVYVGQAGYRKGEGLKQRLEYHIKGKGPSSFREHVQNSLKEGPLEFNVGKQPPPADELFAQVPESLKTTIFDGRTGEPFEQAATIGYIYMLKLHHLVDDKIHARATGPYSLITQQPLGGKARTGGQRFGEMEVWALEGYGAAYTLQELLTVKSDDIEGRTKIYESMVKGENTLEAGTPVSFDVLCNEIRGLGLNIQLEKKRLGSSGL